jgi:hypothetical protein
MRPQTLVALVALVATGGFFLDASLALTPSGAPRVAAYTGSETAFLRFASLVDGAWVLDDVAAFGQYPSLAIDAHGIPHLTVYDPRPIGPGPETIWPVGDLVEVDWIVGWAGSAPAHETVPSPRT